MSDQQPDTAQHTSAGVAVSWRRWLTSAAPFVVTVCVSVALTLLVQAALPPPPPPAPVFSPAVPASQLPSAPLPPTDTLALANQTITRTDQLPINQQLGLLHHEVSNLWTAYYLARAASQIADAEAALRVNDLSEVEQVLSTVDASLRRAYERSAEQEKGPINEFRMQIDTINEDLRMRPEGMDQRLQRLRQSMLSLVDEGG